MRIIIAIAVVSNLFLVSAQAAEKKIALKDVPPAVQQAIKAQSGGATLRGVSQEVEKGKTLYEAEFKIEGHSKDITFDEQGAIISVEEEVPLNQIPATARTAIEKAAGAGKVLEVEMVTEGGKTFYEAQISRDGKKSEVKVDASGVMVK
jgi:uncharacterized membrane protein YkoI